MKSVVDRLFPEDGGSKDVLAGLPDQTDGWATAYFAGLSDTDREVVQDCLERFISPLRAETYALDLANGYAIEDPSRSSELGVEAAVRELGRIKRYLELFLESGEFFPWIRTYVVPIRDENGRSEGSTWEKGWGKLADQEGAFNQSYHQATVRKTVLPIVEYAVQFIQDPSDNPVFSQAQILRRYEEAQGAKRVDLDNLY